MEELFVFALLLYEDLMTEDAYNKRLDELFLSDSENDDLVYLEWESDIKKQMLYIRTYLDYNGLNNELFGKTLINTLNGIYKNCSDLIKFGEKTYDLWQNLPAAIQDKDPFSSLCYADDPLSWGDEKQTRNIYEHLLNYYDK